MVRIFISYKINPAVTKDEYRNWSRSVDQPAAGGQPGINRYEIYECTSGESGSPPWCDIMEVIDAESIEAWEAVDNAPEMQKAVSEFWKMCDPESVKVVYSNQLT